MSVFMGSVQLDCGCFFDHKTQNHFSKALCVFHLGNMGLRSDKAAVWITEKPPSSAVSGFTIRTVSRTCSALR